MPRGAPAGVFEALKLWNNDKVCYVGQGVSKAVEHINKTTGPAPRSKTLSFVKWGFDQLMAEVNGVETNSNSGAVRDVPYCPKAGAAGTGLPGLSHGCRGRHF